MTKKFRRIVTAEDADGKSYVLSDGEPEIAAEIANMGRLYTLWKTETMPVPVPVVEDLDLSGPPDLRPGPQGTHFRLVVIAPESQMSEADKAKMVAAMEAEEDLERDDSSGDPMMHRTETLDYLIVLSGELHMALDSGEIVVGAGDFIVQGGANHSWSNRGDEPAVLIGAMLGGARA